MNASCVTSTALARVTLHMLMTSMTPDFGPGDRGGGPGRGRPCDGALHRAGRTCRSLVGQHHPVEHQPGTSLALVLETSPLASDVDPVQEAPEGPHEDAGFGRLTSTSTPALVRKLVDVALKDPVPP